MMGYDAMALGETDLQLGSEVLQQRMAEAEFPILSANVLLAAGGAPLTDPYVILPLNAGYQVGVIGITGQPEGVPADFVISDPSAAVAEVLPEVVDRVDLVILLSHLGWAENIRLAEQFPEVFMIVGGGRQMPGDQVYTAAQTGTQLAQADHATTGHAGRYIGQWELALDASGQPSTAGWQYLPLDPEVADDAQMLVLLRRYGVLP